MGRGPARDHGQRCLFTSDLHGGVERYRCLLRVVEEEVPTAVLLGGDLLPSGYLASWDPGTNGGDFVHDFLAAGFTAVKERMGERYPEVILIMGNDDLRVEEEHLLEGERNGLWRYVHNRCLTLGEHDVYGYSFVPPTPFLLKDWERYDVSRYVDPGCVSPEEGRRSVPVRRRDARYRTIGEDLERLAGERDQERAIWLFHTPPHRTKLDRAALDGKMIDHVPLDPHIGSIAVRRFIESRQPLVTLHGHVHESARLTGAWRDRLGRTHLFGGAHDGPELSLIRFDLGDPAAATRELL